MNRKINICLMVLASSLLLMGCTKASLETESQNQTTAKASGNTTGVEFGFTTHFFVFTPESRLDLNAFYRSLDEMQGKVEWIRVRMTTWELSHWEQPQPATKMKWLDENVRLYQTALQEAKKRGFKIYAYAELDDRIGRHESFAVSEKFFRQWMRGLAQKFPTVDAWQVLNEANWTNFFTSEALFSTSNWEVPQLTATYLEQLEILMRIAREEIKAAQPQALVTTNNGGWMSGDGARQAREKQRLFQFFDKIRPHLDFISLDIYPQTEADVARLPAQLKEFGSRYGDLWVAETGHSSCKTTSGEDWQGHLIPQILRAMVQGGVSKIILFQYDDYDIDGTACANSFGIKEGQRFKRSYQPVMNVIAELRGTAVDDIAGDDGGGEDVLTPIEDSNPLALNRYLSVNPFDHWITTGSVPGSYKYEFTLGYMRSTASAGTHALYSCKMGTNHWISTQSNCEGHTFIKHLGYVWDGPGAGRVALHRCYFAGPGWINHYISLEDDCENSEAHHEFIVGYVDQVPSGNAGSGGSGDGVVLPQPTPIPTPAPTPVPPVSDSNEKLALNRYLSVNPFDHWITTGSVPSFYKFEFTLGYVRSTSANGMHALYSCKMGTNHWVSTQSNCEGHEKIKEIGYVWSNPGPGRHALYRCYFSGPGWINHFVSLEENCELPSEVKKEFIIGYAESN